MLQVYEEKLTASEAHQIMEDSKRLYDETFKSAKE